MAKNTTTTNKKDFLNSLKMEAASEVGVTLIVIYGATAPIIPYFRSLLQGLYNSCRKASV